MKYYVIKYGVYLHGVYGPYNSEEEAQTAFDKAYAASTNDDFDGHHDYSIIQGLPQEIGVDIDNGGITTIQHKPKHRRRG